MHTTLFRIKRNRCASFLLLAAFYLFLFLPAIHPVLHTAIHQTEKKELGKTQHLPRHCFHSCGHNYSYNCISCLPHFQRLFFSCSISSQNAEKRADCQKNPSLQTAEAEFHQCPLCRFFAPLHYLLVGQIFTTKCKLFFAESYLFAAFEVRKEARHYIKSRAPPKV